MMKNNDPYYPPSIAGSSLSAMPTEYLRIDDNGGEDKSLFRVTFCKLKGFEGNLYTEDELDFLNKNITAISEYLVIRQRSQC